MEGVDDWNKVSSFVVGATPRRSASSLDGMPNPLLLRQAVCFAGSVFITMELVNFPVAVGIWKGNAVAISVVNLLICVNAIASGLLALRMLKARAIRLLTLVLAGLLSGIELIQFAPFEFPLAFPKYIVVGGILCAIVPMMLTLFVLGYLFSKRKDSVYLDVGK
jgi:hypothetical protein